MDLIWVEIELLPKDCTIVHGAQGVFRKEKVWIPGRSDPVWHETRDVESGADMLADEVARRLGLAREKHPAKWRVNGSFDRQAGFKRNIEMLESGVDFVLAFWDGSSPGTAHTLREAKKRSIPTKIVRF